MNGKPVQSKKRRRLDFESIHRRLRGIHTLFISTEPTYKSQLTWITLVRSRMRVVERQAVSSPWQKRPSRAGQFRNGTIDFLKPASTFTWAPIAAKAARLRGKSQIATRSAVAYNCLSMADTTCFLCSSFLLPVDNGTCAENENHRVFPSSWFHRGYGTSWYHSQVHLILPRTSSSTFCVVTPVEKHYVSVYLPKSKQQIRLRIEHLY